VSAPGATSAALARRPESAPRSAGQQKAAAVRVGSRARRTRGRAVLLGAISIGAVLSLWQLASTFAWVNPLFLPTPAMVAAELWELFTTPGSRIWNDLAVSGIEFVLGLSIAIVIGGVLGVLMGWFLTIDGLLRPLVVAVNSTPMVAIIPLIILIFGVDILPKVIIVVIGCSITIILNTAAGVVNVDQSLLQVARSMNATTGQLIRTVVTPSLIPYFMVGVRISVGTALIGIVTAEFLASRAGLGNLLITASNSFDMPLVYATVLILTFVGITLTQLAALLERRIQRWKA